ncbi:hypothetical protein HYV81_04030 [Candidatus Woesearchaeota archaeon]|nr:hypothetical protein [Candidatus Woesearchaeota archaeon]
MTWERECIEPQHAVDTLYGGRQPTGEYWELFVRPTNVTGHGILVDRLSVGVQDGNSVTSIGVQYATEDGVRLAQFSFDNNNPAGWYMDGKRQAVWPANLGFIAQLGLRHIYEELSAIKPSAAQSIDACLDQLGMFGHVFSGRT